MERRLDVEIGSASLINGCGDADLGVKKRKVGNREGTKRGLEHHLALC
jgi:hypothetical protein